MITSVPSVCLSVAGGPGARRGVPVDLARHKGRVHCACGGVSYKQGQRRFNIARTAGIAGSRR